MTDMALFAGVIRLDDEPRGCRAAAETGATAASMGLLRDVGQPLASHNTTRAALFRSEIRAVRFWLPV